MAKYIKEKDRTTTTYHALQDEPVEVFGDDDPYGARTVHRSADVDVKPSREMPLYDEGSAWQDPIRDLKDIMWESDASAEEMRRAVERQEQTPELFHHVPATIDAAFADPVMRPHMGTLLGLVINDHGKDLRPSSDLSKHSSRLAKKGLKAGVVQPHYGNPDAVVSNNYDFGNRRQVLVNGMPDFKFADSVEIVPEEDVAAARKTVRGILRPKPVPPLSPQFQALQQFEKSGKSTYNPKDDPNAMQLPGMD